MLAPWKTRAAASFPLLHAIRVRSADCELWLVELDGSAIVLQGRGGGAHMLTPSDHARLRRIRDPMERARRAVTYIALRMIVARTLGARHARARMLRPRGRAPRLAGVPATFNLSHCENWALIGLARRGRIGVDLEVVRQLPMTQRRRTQLTAAAGALARGRPLTPDRDGDVLQAWTRLESFSKATGRGINRTLADFGIRAQQNPRWHTQGATVPEIAQRQLRGYRVIDLCLPQSLIAAVTRTLSFRS